MVNTYYCESCQDEHEATATIDYSLPIHENLCSAQKKGPDGLWRVCHTRFDVAIQAGRARLCPECAVANGIKTPTMAKLFQRLVAKYQTDPEFREIADSVSEEVHGSKPPQPGGRHE